MKCLAVLLFHNDEDLVDEQMKYWIKNKHDIVIFDHCSTDSTKNIVETHRKECVAVYYVPKSVTFADNGIFKHVSLVLIMEYANMYDWITFVESDEFYEGPDRSKSYYKHLLDVHKSKYDYIHFDNYNFWFTNKDDPNIANFRKRIRHYAFRFDYKRIYAWRGHLTNIRKFNGNPPKGGDRYPIPFKSCHYEMRSLEQLKKKLSDRQKSIKNAKGHNHTKEMLAMSITDLLSLINPDKLYYDDGEKELIKKTSYNWRGERRNKIAKNQNKK